MKLIFDKEDIKYCKSLGLTNEEIKNLKWQMLCFLPPELINEKAESIIRERGWK